MAMANLTHISFSVIELQTFLVQNAEHELWKHSWHLQNFTFFSAEGLFFCFVSEIIIKIDLQIFGQNDNFIFTFSYVS